MKHFYVKFLAVALTAGFFASCGSDDSTGTTPAEGATTWSGTTMTYTKADGADPTMEANQDRITDNVWLTRGNSGGHIFNAKSETASSTNTPSDTEWAIGTTATLSSLTFQPFRTVYPKPKNDIVGEDLVLHLITDDIYIDIKFTSWSTDKTGGFTYERSTK